MQDISEHIRQPGVTVWLDMCAPDADDLATISEELNLHRLAVEDAVQEHQRPKLDRYDSHLFVNVYATGLFILAGFFGTVVDSLLGAVFERRGLLDNDLVNLLSTAAAVGMAWGLR